MIISLLLYFWVCDFYFCTNSNVFEVVNVLIVDEECVSNRWENAQQISKTPLKSHGKSKHHQ